MSVLVTKEAPDFISSAILADGIIVEDGISEDLFESPKHIYTQELLEASIV